MTFVLDNQSVCSSLGITLSPTLSIPDWLVALYIGLSPHDVPAPTLACLLLLSLFGSCLGNPVAETLWAWFLTLLCDTVLQQIP